MSYRYRTVKHPDTGQSIGEHRLVMEQELGRELRTDEHVHHINGDTFDNRPENLEVLSPAEHMRLHKQKHPYVKDCEVCSEEFEPEPTKRARAKTCSDPCFRELVGRQKRGEQHPSSVLTREMVAEARMRVSGGEMVKDVAAAMGVNKRTLGSAVAGRTWAHIEDPPPVHGGGR